MTYKEVLKKTASPNYKIIKQKDGSFIAAVNGKTTHRSKDGINFTAISKDTPDFKVNNIHNIPENYGVWQKKAAMNVASIFPYLNKGMSWLRGKMSYDKEGNKIMTNKAGETTAKQGLTNAGKRALINPSTGQAVS